MGQYTDLPAWEKAWKRTPSVKEFKEGWRGTLKEFFGVWHAIREESAGNMEIWGCGDTQQEAVALWWENRLNALAPQSLKDDCMILMLRGSGDPKYQHVRIKGYDDDDE